MTDEKYAQRKIDALNTRALTAKRDYVRELEQRGDPEALQLLVECMADESWFMRDLAEEAFLRLGDRGAPALLPLLGRGLWFTRTSAARTLGRLGYRPAVPGLLRLAEDSNGTVTDAARDALIAIGRLRGSASIAHAVHRLPPDIRRARMDEFAQRDRSLSDRIERLMRSDDLMAADDIDGLADDSAPVRAVDDGVEWEILTGPPPAKSEAESQGAGRS